MNELNKLEDLDRRVLIWCANHMAQHVSHVLEMHKKDYKKKGIDLDVSKMLSELRKELK